MQFTYVSRTLHTHSLEETLGDIFNDFLHETKFHDVGFPTCGIMSVFRKFWIWGLGFWPALAESSPIWRLQGLVLPRRCRLLESLAYRLGPPISASLIAPCPPWVSVLKSPFSSKNTSHWAGWSPLSLILSAKTYFQIAPHSR